MQVSSTLVFACAHLTDERLFAHQVAALSPTHDCRVFAFRDLPTLGAMAVELLAHAPPRFTLIGLSLGGYLAFEIVRRQPERIERLVLLDARAVDDTETVRKGRLADIAKVQAGGIDALIPELPERWTHPANRPRVTDLMTSMARSIGDRNARFRLTTTSTLEAGSATNSRSSRTAWTRESLASERGSKRDAFTLTFCKEGPALLKRVGTAW